MAAKVVDGRKIARKIKEEVKDEVEKLKSKYQKVPNIVTIKIGNDSSSELYLKLRNKACNEVGIKSESMIFEETVKEDVIVKTINDLNNDSKVHGILIQYPVPKHISEDKLMRTVSPKKDVEGLNPYNMGSVVLGEELIVPCTPLAVLKILESEKEELKGKNITIVNHSNIVGKPLSNLLLNRNATVSICHVFTKDMAKFTLDSDILITAAGVPKLINEKHVKKNAFVIDVGIVETENGICGDVDFKSVESIAGKITPVPGGVGPVTIACSLVNMIKTFGHSMNFK